MKQRRLRSVAAVIAAVVVLAVLGGSGSALARDIGSVAGQAAEPAVPVAKEMLIFSYAAKFVCHEPVSAAVISVNTKVPLVREATDVLVHNPNGYAVTFYKKAVIASLEEDAPIEPGKWRRFDLKPDYSMRIDCDDIAKLLTGDPQATFVGKFGVGVRVEGFVVIGIGPQAVAGTAAARYLPLDVTAEYVRGSEVLKKDIHLQPWWHHWWWPLPWRLGFPYERRLMLGASDANIDCRGLLYKMLAMDVQQSTMDPTMKPATLAALIEGERLGPTSLPAPDSPPALVVLIGRCEKIDLQVAAVDYTLVSNKGPTDPNPLGTAQPSVAVAYPWIPGRWNDLAVVLPQQHNVDLDKYIREWYAARWTDNGADQALVQVSMAYFFPWWCGTTYWWGWGPGSCVDIGVGEGESLQVLPVTPSRVFMPVWPPVAGAVD